MRIISGTHRGRRLEAPRWDGLRPSSDRLRETLFNILAPRIEGARVLDGCAGTGAVGIEAVSRGAAHVTFVDDDRRAIELIARNLARCRIEGGHAIIRADLSSPGTRLPTAAFDLVFIDPPYDMDPVEMMRAAAGWLRNDGWLVLEHARRRAVPARVGSLVQVRRVASGDSVLAFFEHEAPPAAADEGR
jgi:16S rRNA (guanine(966)-N(2))-methyltransferase RsmD